MKRSSVFTGVTCALLAIAAAAIGRIRKSPSVLVYYYAGPGQLNCTLAPNAPCTHLGNSLLRCTYRANGQHVYLLYTDSFCTIPAYYNPQ